MKPWIHSHPTLTSLIFWAIAVVATLLCFTYQDKTGPTNPLESTFQAVNGPVHFKFLRSETIGNDLQIMLLDPVPQDVTASVKYRRFNSYDSWSTLPMKPGSFTFARRGSTEAVTGIGAALPSLKERAGKYEYFVYIKDGPREPVSITGGNPVLARYEASVPTPVLIVHILIIFLSMVFAIRTVLEALRNGSYNWMLWATLISLLLGAFVLGPLVQWYAFGVWWSGIPYGFDWTDNKVLLELAFWVVALVLNSGGRRSRRAVYAAAIVTLIVYFIPHSLFGSEYNYRTGTGTGTSG